MTKTYEISEWHKILREYLHSLYQGVFSDDAVETHIRDYIGTTFAQYACSIIIPHLPSGSSILDIGSGFGAFVLLARESGFDARGIEPATFEVDFARMRLKALRPQDNDSLVYQVKRAEDLKNSSDRFGAVTLWNAVEHIPNTRRLLETCHDLLIPGGRLFIIAPNYSSWRDEAHYQIPWTPWDLFSRKRFSKKLVSLGKNPKYFLQGIVTVTNWGVLRDLAHCGFRLYDFSGVSMNPIPTLSLGKNLIRLRFWNPFAPSILIMAEKRGAKQCVC